MGKRVEKGETSVSLNGKRPRPATCGTKRKKGGREEGRQGRAEERRGKGRIGEGEGGAAEWLEGFTKREYISAAGREGYFTCIGAGLPHQSVCKEWDGSGHGIQVVSRTVMCAKVSLSRLWCSLAFRVSCFRRFFCRQWVQVSPYGGPPFQRSTLHAY